MELNEVLVPHTHLDHVELSDAVLLHAHRHGDPVLLDQHGRAWRLLCVWFGTSLPKQHVHTTGVIVIQAWTRAERRERRV